ncbi:MAG: hypothetical protein FWC42_08805 [Proteobacteria bacterium]|nr:hypothetical protein [Pseudomonadota bacterium]
MKTQDARATTNLSLSPKELISFSKANALIRLLMLLLIALGMALAPALVSAQTLTVEAWQKVIKDTLPSQLGCFEISYPNISGSKHLAPLAPARFYPRKTWLRVRCLESKKT